jgi:hypothetical protein
LIENPGNLAGLEATVNFLRREGHRDVTALGGNLELVAAFGNKKIVLCGVESGVPAITPANKRRQRTRPARARKLRR